MLLRFPPFPGRVENKKSYGSLKVLNIFKLVLQIMIDVLRLYKNVLDDSGLPHYVVFLFQAENGLHGK